MKKSLKTLLLSAAILAISLPSYANHHQHMKKWYCVSSNWSKTHTWGWYSKNLNHAKMMALQSCQNSHKALFSEKCYIRECVKK
ncbi:MAG: hypothetical protein AB7F64_05355 [Gammaproteobacteria bacterium]